MLPAFVMMTYVWYVLLDVGWPGASAAGPT
ncbi:hypothetical protein F01_420114 [Burkholderia cenocepacia]|nr:hypothetical protein F01_420114 [Burkholderia cenocepacia]